VTQPASDDVDLDAGLEKMNGGSVSEDVRTDRSPRPIIIEACSMTPHDLVDPKAGKWASLR